MKLKISLVTLLICLLVIIKWNYIRSIKIVRKGCVEGWLNKGELERANAVQDIKNNYVTKVINLINVNTDSSQETLITVGHQFGDYKNYPKFPDEIQNKSFDTVRMMKDDFDDLELKGVEFKEKQIIAFASQGYANKDIGIKLTLSEITVKNYLYRIYKKLNINNRKQLRAYQI